MGRRDTARHGGVRTGVSADLVAGELEEAGLGDFVAAYDLRDAAGARELLHGRPVELVAAAPGDDGGRRGGGCDTSKGEITRALRCVLASATRGAVAKRVEGREGGG